MSDYSCHEHGKEFVEGCVPCEFAGDISRMEKRIEELEAKVTALEFDNKNLLEFIYESTGSRSWRKRDE